MLVRKAAIKITLNIAALLIALLTCSFPPLWDFQGMEFVLEFFSQVANQVPCQELSFRTEKSALELVKKISKW
jgi:hypothetical protein